MAGGLGRHLNVDPTILRVLFVALSFFGGAGVVLYGALWLFVPEEHTGNTVVPVQDSSRNAVLLAAAVLAATLAIGDAWYDRGFPWALVAGAIVLGVVLLNRDGNRSSASPGPTSPGPTSPGPTSPGPTSPGPTSPGPGGWGPPQGTAPEEGAAYPDAPMAEPVGAHGYALTSPYTAPWYPPAGESLAQPPARSSRKRGPVLFGPTLALVLLGIGALGLYDATGGSVADAAYPALALAVVGAMLVVGAFVGRPGGLALLGAIAALALPVIAIGQPGFDGDRDLELQPTSATSVAGSYAVPAGRIELDLTRVEDLTALDGHSIGLDVSAGEVVVVVPEELGVQYDARVQLGGMVETPDGQRDGWDSRMAGRLSGTSDATVTLDIDVTFGHIEVRQR